MKIALVHDWLIRLGGAERVLIEFHLMYPEAPIYTLFYDKRFVRDFLPYANIQASFLQKFPFITRMYKSLALLMPLAIESFDFSDYDKVLSSSVFFSKGLIVRPKTTHISYCYSPTRQLWDRATDYEGIGSWGRLAQHILRIWDRSAAERVDRFVAISSAVAGRIKKYYNRDSAVIYPPLKQFSNLLNDLQELNLGEFYLIVSRLYPHKNIDIAVDAFNKLGYNLAIVGDGPLRTDLERKAGQNILFLGYTSDAELATCYATCKALILPQEEDFGLTPLEAMSFGKPVLALRRGGAMETVQEGITGEFFDDPIPEALADGVKRLNQNYSQYNPEIIRQSVEPFSLTRFQEEIRKVVN